MFTWKRFAIGCFLLPLLLFGGCCGKMYADWRMYELPGEVLKSAAKPTVELASALRVAQELDDYVQPRFEILRDKNFGAFRIVYKHHAGIVQLKVDTDKEKEQIANVNGAKRDYAICLLHCASKPGRERYNVTPRLELLYFNQTKVAPDYTMYARSTSSRAAELNGLVWASLEMSANKSLPHLMSGEEKRAGDKSWEGLMRPVLASNQECLCCHTNAKPGSTIGVMGYAVRKT